MTVARRLARATQGYRGAVGGGAGTIVSVGEVVIQQEDFSVTFDPEESVTLPDGSSIEVTQDDFVVVADPEFVDVEVDPDA